MKEAEKIFDCDRTSGSYAYYDCVCNTFDTHQVECSLCNRVYKKTGGLPLSKPPIPKCRRPLHVRLRNSEEKNCSQNNYHNSDMENNISGQSKLNSSKSESEDNSTDDRQSKNIPDEHMKRDKRRLSSHSQNDISSKEKFSPENSQLSNSYLIKKQNTKKLFFTKYSYYLVAIIPISIAIIAIIVNSSSLDLNKKQTQHINPTSQHINPTSQFKSFEKIKAKFYNQESDTWNDISIAINEIISRDPGNKPQIILLFANETSTMDCLATELARVLSDVLDINDSLELNPENFGDDAGEIIDKLKKHSSAKKVVLIRNVLNINAEAIKALHNLCDKISPLIREAIYIFTMQTNNYQSSQKKLKFVEDQFYHELSKSIDEDILMALVTRVTDATIISVQPEPHLRYCQS